MRVFLDTNVLVSALTSHGLCAALVRRLLEISTCQLLVSQSVLDELHRVIHDKFGIHPADLLYTPELLARLQLAADALEDSIIDVPDPDDAPIVSAAAHAGCDFFVTGDQVLLKLGEIKRMVLISPRGLWERLQSRI